MRSSFTEDRGKVGEKGKLRKDKERSVDKALKKIKGGLIKNGSNQRPNMVRPVDSSKENVYFLESSPEGDNNREFLDNFNRTLEGAIGGKYGGKGMGVKIKDATMYTFSSNK